MVDYFLISDKKKLEEGEGIGKVRILFIIYT